MNEFIVDAVIESPMGCRHKFKYDDTKNVFRLKKTLPLGAMFPFDFGFVAETLAEDGDPIDIMVLTDEGTTTGCIISCRIIGAIMAEQTKNGKTVRNDRLLAIPRISSAFCHITDIGQLNPGMVQELEHFFISYNTYEGKIFKPVGRAGAGEAMELLRASRDAFKDGL